MQLKKLKSTSLETEHQNNFWIMSAEGWCCQNRKVGVGEENQGIRPLQTVSAYPKETLSKHYTISVSSPGLGGKFPPWWHSAALSASWPSSSQAELMPSFSKVSRPPRAWGIILSHCTDTHEPALGHAPSWQDTSHLQSRDHSHIGLHPASVISSEWRVWDQVYLSKWGWLVPYQPVERVSSQLPAPNAAFRALHQELTGRVYIPSSESTQSHDPVRSQRKITTSDISFQLSHKPEHWSLLSLLIKGISGNLSMVSIREFSFLLKCIIIRPCRTQPIATSKRTFCNKPAYRRPFCY